MILRKAGYARKIGMGCNDYRAAAASAVQAGGLLSASTKTGAGTRRSGIVVTAAQSVTKMHTPKQSENTLP